MHEPRMSSAQVAVLTTALTRMSMLDRPLILLVSNHLQHSPSVVVLSYLKMNHRDQAPHTPRVIFLGPTGCGKSVQAELLASKYGLVNGKINKWHAVYSTSVASLLF